MLWQAKRTVALERNLPGIKIATRSAGPDQQCWSYTMPIILLIEVPIVLSDAFEPEGETSDLADPAIVYLASCSATEIAEEARGSSARVSSIKRRCDGWP